MIRFSIDPYHVQNVPGKLADVEIEFRPCYTTCAVCHGRKVVDDQPCEHCEGHGYYPSPVEGLRIVGLAVWERNGKRTVTFPEGEFFEKGKRRQGSFLRAVRGSKVLDLLRDQILEGYAAVEQAMREGE